VLSHWSLHRTWIAAAYRRAGVAARQPSGRLPRLPASAARRHDFSDAGSKAEHPAGIAAWDRSGLSTGPAELFDRLEGAV
jgi:hypothetical protein